MTKLFKNSKQVLSFVLAFAVLAVSLFTGVVINSQAACDDSTVIYWGGSVTSVSSFDELGGKGTSDEPYIIDSAADLALIAGATIDSANLYFKVADGIDAIVLQSESVGAGILELTSASAVKDYFEDTSKTGFVEWVRGNWSTPTPFIGSFDGNGVEIYGLYANTPNDVNPLAGLFTQIDAGAAISNVTVKNSYINSKSYAAFIAPFSGSNSQGLKTTGTVSFSQCIVANCYMVSNVDNCTNKAGVMTGTMNDYINMSNCMVYGNDANNVAVPYKDDSSIKGFKLSLVGDLENVKDPVDSITNCICLGTTPYPQYNCGFNNLVGPDASMFSNVYTDQATEDISLYLYDGASAAYKYYNKAAQVIADSLTSITESQILSKNAMYVMPNLDWENIWLVEEGKMPEFRSNHNMSSTATAGTDGHTYNCADCELVTAEYAHTYGADSKCTACGAEKICGSGTIEYWDGTRDTTLADNGEDGSAGNPIIIDSAEELALLVRTTAANTQGKHYKVSDEISAIILQPESVIDDASAFMALSDAAAVKKYFEDKIAAGTTPLDWKTINYYWEGIFDGHFDGNGVEIYGLYSNSDNAALFFMADGGGDTKIDTAELKTIYEGGTTFKNFAVKNAYLTTSNRGGAIVGQAYGASQYGANVNGIINIDSCIVANCYMRQTATGKMQMTGLVTGDIGSDTVNINNLLVYGNDAWNTAENCAIALRAIGANRKAADGETVIYSKITNSIVLGIAPYNLNNYNSASQSGALCFENVFTDQPAGEVVMKNTWGSTTTVTFTEEQVKQVAATTGADIKNEIGDGLDWVNTWFAVEDDVPALRAFHTGFAAATDNGDGTHSETCNCGLKGIAAEHTFDKTAADSKCTVCGALCAHDVENIVWVSNNDATCLTADTGHYECTACGLKDEDMENPDFEAGHKFEDVEAIPADCQGAGTIAHKLCTVCDNAFATTAAIDEPIENALDSTVDPIKAHTAKTDSNGDILYNMNESGHSKTCSVCEQEFDAEAHASDDYTADKEGHTGTCAVCKLATSGKEAHVFGDDNVCDTCNWACTAHDYVDGDTVELTFEQRYGEDSESYKDICYYVEQICSICGTKGENKPIAHTPGEWETNPNADNQPACAGDGYHTEVLFCTECFYQIESKVVNDPKTGHQFKEYEEEAPTCTNVGTIAYKQCEACWECYAMDDEANEKPLDLWSDEMDIPVDPEAHVWVEYESTATCEEGGVAAHKFCADCFLFVVNGEETDVMIDWDAFWAYDEETGEPIGIGAKVDANYSKIEAEAFEDFLAENYADQGFELPAYPEDPNDWDAMGAYNDAKWEVENALFELDENWYQAWGEYSMAVWSQAQVDAYYEALLLAAEEAEVDMTAEATGHTLVKVDEVAATYEADGVKAHYACENCDKLFADENGTEEVTAEELVIAKLVKAEESKPSTDDKEDDKTDGDNSDKSPATGESIAVVAAVAALMGAAFVLVRKARKA